MNSLGIPKVLWFDSNELLFFVIFSTIEFFVTLEILILLEFEEGSSKGYLFLVSENNN